MYTPARLHPRTMVRGPRSEVQGQRSRVQGMVGAPRRVCNKMHQPLCPLSAPWAKALPLISGSTATRLQGQILPEVLVGHGPSEGNKQLGGEHSILTHVLRILQLHFSISSALQRFRRPALSFSAIWSLIELLLFTLAVGHC